MGPPLVRGAGQESSPRRGSAGRVIPAGSCGGTNAAHPPGARLGGGPGPRDPRARAHTQGPGGGGGGHAGPRCRGRERLCPARTDQKLPKRSQLPEASLSPSAGSEVSPLVIPRRLPDFYYCYELVSAGARAQPPLPPRALCPHAAPARRGPQSSRWH